ncbi:AAA family ATPase [Candidatus Synechococcus spongiarum]|uniref:Nuclease SbcCD subunit C n=1 Tax=Candidatus Synechococcus spongiarum TaxID=431041 RepID=A0A165B0R2_9SYNE|nr:AAA family ATPase [Candidatus Synechococcus spongiarum]SAY38746.1 DNA double-strand break repair Rad50 ATPase [Candidatus Synechococcus spongiarum]
MFFPRMQLKHCRICNVRVHRELSLDFAPGLTLIGGANEAGKSTLLEALRRVLFLKATTSGAVVNALRSRTHPGVPTVELTFAARGRSWRLHKEFGGARGRTELHPSGGSPLTGPEAQEMLATLLESGGPLDGRAGSDLYDKCWGHLWVVQGEAGNDPLQDRETYPLEQLIRQLEQRGGAALQSPFDQQVADRVNEQLNAIFTNLGRKPKPKKYSSLWTAEQEEKQAAEDLKQAKQRVVDDKVVSQELAQVDDKLAEVCGQLDDLKTRLPKLRELQNQCLLEGSKLKTLNIRVESLGQDQSRLKKLTSTGQQYKLDQEQYKKNEKALASQLASAQQTQAEHQKQVDDLQERDAYLSHKVAQLQCWKEQRRLQQEIQALQEQQQAQEQLNSDLRHLPAVDLGQVKELRRLEDRQRDCRTRQDAMAATVELLYAQAHQQVRLGEQPLTMGQPLPLTGAAELRVGDDVTVRISPGGDQAALAKAHQEATQALEEKLRCLGVASVEVADEISRKRQELQAQLQPADPQTLQSLQEELTHVEAQKQQLAQEAPGQAAPGKADPTPTGEVPLTTAGLECQLGEHQNASREVKNLCRQAEEDLRLAQKALTDIETKQAQVQTQLQALASQEEDRRGQVEELLATYKTTEALEKLHTQEKQKQTISQAELKKLQQQLQALTVPESGAPEMIIPELERQERELQDRQQELLHEEGTLQERRRSISSQEEDPMTTLEKAQAAWEQAREQREHQQQLGKALLLLKELFQQAQADLSSRYTEPLAQAISSYLAPLYPDRQGGPVCEMSYTQDTGLHGLQLWRDQNPYDFAQLSGGMREQFAAALRLSMADVLKHRHDGCLPLIFDDAFTNTDPERIPMVSRMLETAVAHGLQVILLTCDPQAYGSLKAERVHGL